MPQDRDSSKLQRVRPAMAAVRPRVLVAGGEVPTLLVDAARAAIARSPWRAVMVRGSVRSDVLAAAAHLAAEAPDIGVAFGELVSVFDPELHADISASMWEHEGEGGLALFVAARLGFLGSGIDELVLAPWTEDEVVEYLVARHRERAASVMKRLGTSRERCLLEGEPGLWRLALDALAGSDELFDAAQAAGAAVRARLADADPADLAAACLESVKAVPFVGSDFLRHGVELVRVSILEERLARIGVPADAIPVLASPALRRILASAWIAESLRDPDGDNPFDRGPLPHPLRAQVIARLAKDPPPPERFEALLAEGPSDARPDIASILHAVVPDWRPAPEHGAWLSGADLRGAFWPEVDLTGADLRYADLSRADLEGAQLERADLAGTRFVGSVLRDATFESARLRSTELDAADLEGAWIGYAFVRGVSFDGANLRAADFEGSRLRMCHFRGADLSRASLHRAAIHDCDFASAVLEGSDWKGAWIKHVDFSSSTLRVASFTCATIEDCSFAGVDLSAVPFRRAWLQRCDLSGTRLANASLRKATFLGCTLGDIDLEGADLRGASFENCTFHMGSSRNGLVGSFLACEGSRTGYYTDESLEQSFRAPEEIRKANLRGANLEGARLNHIDLYLVDLRNAILTPLQRAWARRCRAILSP